MDVIENIKGSVIQHGPHNNRIYLMQLNQTETRGLIADLDAMAVKNGYGKIFAKIAAPAWEPFRAAGFIKEAVVPGLFSGESDGFFIAKYLSTGRQTGQSIETLLKPVKQAGEGSVNDIPPTAGAMGDVVACTPVDAAEMSLIYRQVFKSYPFPIQEPAYLEDRMKEGALYFGIRIEGGIAALAAAEIDLANKNAEMTDFATLPKWRKMGFAGMLLAHLESTTRKLEIGTAYTIARAASLGMNSVFKGSGYSYSGLLKNNTQICGSIQSMTVWHKHF